MKPYTPTQAARIANNALKACTDIDKLDGPTYKFLNLCAGFIAHYDLQGFKEYYRDEGSLEADLIANARMNQWANFKAGEPHADYYHAKRDIYNQILGKLSARDFIREHVLFVTVKD
jgi:hypothetical protein